MAKSTHVVNKLQWQEPIYSFENKIKKKIAIRYLQCQGGS